MSLYQKVRPKKFDDIVGNSTTIGNLRRMLRKSPDSQPHAILLKGPTGCGKTTIARILAKELGSTENTTFELNAANTRGIETIRDLDSSIHLCGLGGKTKTYIIDECAQLTGPAQEALLKTLEDTPLHCYFIFCTTDPEKIIETIHNRCSEYEVEILLDKEIFKVLERACKEVDLQVTSEVLLAIAQTCDSPRAALVLLEKVAETKDVDEAFEIIARGTEKDADVLDLLKLLIMSPEQRQKRWKQIVKVFAAIDEDASEKIRRAILTFLFNKLKKTENVEDAKDIAHLLGIFSMSTFYGKKPQLGALVVRACFETWKDRK